MAEGACYAGGDEALVEIIRSAIWRQERQRKVGLIRSRLRQTRQVNAPLLRLTQAHRLGLVIQLKRPASIKKHSLNPMNSTIRSFGVWRSTWLVSGLLTLAIVTVSAQPGPGFALRVADTSSYVAVPQAVGLNSFPFTVMAWVNTSATTGQQGLVNKYVAGSQNGWNLFLKDGRVRAWFFATNTRFVWDGANGLDGGSIADGAWHHIAFTVDGSGGRLYVDGALRASRAWTGTSGPPNTTQEMRFGNYPGGILSFFGTISLDEITVWNAALSQSQVAANMFTPLVGNEANLVALYRCDEGGGTSVADSAPLGGNNNGAWAGTAVFVPTVVAPQAASEGGAARANCSGTPGITDVKLDWRGQNVVGCKVDLDWSRSRIRRVAPDCTTIYTADLPSAAPRQWTILSQPIGSDIDLEITATSVRLPLPVAGNYTVQLTVCPGDCVVPGPDGNNFPMVPSTATITIRAEAELPLRAQEQPVLPPAAMMPTPAGRRCRWSCNPARHDECASGSNPGPPCTRRRFARANPASRP